MLFAVFLLICPDLDPFDPSLFAKASDLDVVHGGAERDQGGALLFGPHGLDDIDAVVVRKRVVVAVQRDYRHLLLRGTFRIFSHDFYRLS